VGWACYDVLLAISLRYDARLLGKLLELGSMLCVGCWMVGYVVSFPELVVCICSSIIFVIVGGMARACLSHNF
jgi:hypothetical protein